MNIENQFQPIAKAYINVEGDRYERTINWPSIDKLLPHPPAKIMDYGCGGGTFSRILISRGYDVLAVDIAPDMVKHLQDASVPVPARLWSYHSKSLGLTFDAIVAKLVVQFIEDLPAFARVTRKHLSPGGRLIISIPNPARSRSLASSRVKGVYLKEIGVSGLKVNMIHREFEDIKKDVEAANFKLIKFHKPVNPADLDEELPKRLNMLFEAQK